MPEIDDRDGAASAVSARLLPTIREHARAALRNL